MYNDNRYHWIENNYHLRGCSKGRVKWQINLGKL